MRPNLAHLVVASLLSLAGAAAPATAAAPPPPSTVGALLTLEQAVALATESSDPALERLTERAEALEERAVADAQLPDPMVTAQLNNVPTDTFALDEADMTQARLGLRQEFPPGRTLAERGRQRHQEAQAQRARRQLELREIALATRQAWFELAYQRQAMTIVARSRESVAQQVDSLAASFATGRINAQAVLRSELELSLLDDRLTEHRRRAEIARAELARYIQEHADRPLPEGWPTLVTLPRLPVLVSRLVDHPAVQAESAEIAAADAAVAIAAEAYKPAWALEGGYGFREDRTDLASIGLTVTRPLFTDKRQDRRHRAAVRQRGAEQLDRDTVLLELRRRLDQAWSDWQRFTERLTLYRSAVGDRARETAEASITTYANGQTDFAELIRSQLAELDTRVTAAELEARAAQAWARIVYLAGESS